MLDKLKFWKPKHTPVRGVDLGTTTVGQNRYGSQDQLGLQKDNLGLDNQYQDPFQPQNNGLASGQYGVQHGQQRQHPGQQQKQQPMHGQQHGQNQQQHPTYARELDHTGLGGQQVHYQGKSPEMELVAAKLDALRVSLDMINQRLNVIEKELQNRHRGW